MCAKRLRFRLAVVERRRKFGVRDAMSVIVLLLVVHTIGALVSLTSKCMPVYVSLLFCCLEELDLLAVGACDFVVAH